MARKRTKVKILASLDVLLFWNNELKVWSPKPKLVTESELSMN